MLVTIDSPIAAQIPEDIAGKEASQDGTVTLESIIL